MTVMANRARQSKFLDIAVLLPKKSFSSEAATICNLTSFYISSLLPFVKEIRSVRFRFLDRRRTLLQRLYLANPASAGL